MRVCVTCKSAIMLKNKHRCSRREGKSKITISATKKEIETRAQGVFERKQYARASDTKRDREREKNCATVIQANR